MSKLDPYTLVEYSQNRHKINTVYNIVYKEFDIMLQFFATASNYKLLKNYIFCITKYMEKIEYYEYDIIYLILSFVKLEDFYENNFLTF